MKADLKQVLASADLIHDQATVEQAIARMAATIRADYPDAIDVAERPLFLTIMHGGLPFAARLAMELGLLGLDLAMDYLHASRYRGETSGRELRWMHEPATPLQGRRVLLVDDILDEGHTLAGILDWCRRQGAAEVRVAVMTVKEHARRVEGVQADYVGLQVPDRYVFGYGMDYHEQGRNLPAIYAME